MAKNLLAVHLEKVPSCFQVLDRHPRVVPRTRAVYPEDLGKVAICPEIER